jgi:hypothetical protein
MGSNTFEVALKKNYAVNFLKKNLIIVSSKYSKVYIFET